MGELLIRVRAVIKALQLPGTKVDEAKRQKEYAAPVEARLGRALRRDRPRRRRGRGEDERSCDLADRASRASSSLLARYEPILQKIQPLAKQIVTTGNFDSVALLVERKYKSALDQLKDELDEITNKQCEIVSTDVDEDTTAAIIVFNKTYSEPVHKFLAIENVNQIRLPSDLQGMAFDQAYETVKERQKTLPKQLEDVEQGARGHVEPSGTCASRPSVTSCRTASTRSRRSRSSARPTTRSSSPAGSPSVDIADLRKTLRQRSARTSSSASSRSTSTTSARLPCPLVEPQGGRAVPDAAQLPRRPSGLRHARPDDDPGRLLPDHLRHDRRRHRLRRS